MLLVPDEAEMNGDLHNANPNLVEEVRGGLPLHSTSHISRNHAGGVPGHTRTTHELDQLALFCLQITVHTFEIDLLLPRLGSGRLRLHCTVIVLAAELTEGET